MPSFLWIRSTRKLVQYRKENGLNVYRETVVNQTGGDVTRQLLCVAVFAFSSTTAQEATSSQSTSLATKPEFEVASVKECKNNDPVPPSGSSPGRLSLGCYSLKVLVQQAYDVFASGKVGPLNPAMPSTPIEGDPAWIRSA